ncbi:MAG TPA: EAL domain-containing protein, partial [Albitalea sp.]|nr:EAL domain-containing protein [Albitalea sp.]
RDLRQGADQAAINGSRLLLSGMGLQRDALYRTVERLAALRGGPDAKAEQWSLEARQHLRDFPAVESFAWHDGRTWHRLLRAGAPLPTGPAEPDSSSEPPIDTLKLRSGPDRMVLETRAVSPQGVQRIVATMHNRRLMDVLFAGSDDGFVYEVQHGAHRLAQEFGGVAVAPAGQRFRAMRPVAIGDAEWTISAAPGPQRLRDAQGPLPEVILLLGLLLTFAGALTLRLAFESKRRARLAALSRLRLLELDRDHRAATTELQRMQVRLHDTLEHMGDAFFLLDSEGRFVYVNAHAAMLMRSDAASLLGHCGWDAFGGTREALCRRMRQAMADGQAQELEYPSHDTDRCYGLRVYPVAGGVAVLLRDITERVRERDALERQRVEAARASQALAASEQRFRSLFEHNPGLAMALDLDGRIQQVNRGMQQLLGHDPRQLIGEPMSVIFPAWDTGVADAQSLLASLVEQRASELIARHADGGRLHIATTLVACVVDGDVQGYFLLGQDVTRMHRTLRQLKLHAEVIERTHDAVVVLDEQGCVASWNRGATRVYGTPAGTMLGCNFEDLFDDVERIAIHDALSRTEHAAQQPAELEVRLQTPQGDTRWVLLSMSRVVAPDGARAFDLVYGLDVTARRLAEDALRHSLTNAQAHGSRLADLTRAAVEIGRCVGTPELMQRIADDMRHLLGAHLCMLSLTRGASWSDAVHAPSLSAKFAGYRQFAVHPVGAGIYSMVLKHGRPMCMTQQQLEQHGRSRGFGEHESAHPPLRGWLAVPLFGRSGQPLGMIQLSDRYEGDFGDDDLATAQQLAQTAAAAIEADALCSRLHSAEQQVRRQLRFTRAITDGLRKALYVFDAQGRLSYSNPAGRALLGANDDPTDAELARIRLGQRPLPAAVRQMLDSAVALGGTDGRLAHDDGRVLDYQLNPLLCDGEHCGIVALVRDISGAAGGPLRLVDADAPGEPAELPVPRPHAQTLDAVLRDHVDALLIVSEGGAILYANHAAARLLGAGASAGHALPAGFPFPPADAAEVSIETGDGEPRVVELRASVTSWNGQGATLLALRDITRLRDDEAQAAWCATHDGLTGLPNRAVLLDCMRQGLAVARRQGCTLAVLHIDVDQFKEVNDTLGDEVGDELLREVAQRVSGCLREGDTLGRVGGDEFIAVLPDLARADDCVGVIERILAATAVPYLLRGQTLVATCSVGVAVGGEHTDDTVLLQQAEAATLAAKKAGRNTHHFFTSDLIQRAGDRLELRTRLQAAISRGEFVLHYQPQVELATRRISGIEALIRWNHPTLGQMSPARFIPVAEDTGQIVAIGEWVLEQACRQHREWLQRGLLDCGVAVNVSGVQFQRANFVEVVEGILKRTGLPAERLELELTESVMMDSAGRASETLRRLRLLGLSVSIDDFGTGYSSLSYLKRFPVDKVKIDKSFIADITRDSDEASITLSVIAIAHHLRMKVIAEGVETPAQMAYLGRHFCDAVQGYLVSRPLPPAELEAFLAGYRPQVGQQGADVPMPRATLLLVDDEPNILRALTRVLRRDGYRIVTANSADEAFDVLAREPVQVVLSDQRMSAMCGTQFLSQVKDLYPHTVRLVLSGYTDLESVTEAVNRGAIYRFLSKPWEDEQLRSHVKDAFMHHERQLRPRAA